jgi:hypothetical protein
VPEGVRALSSFAQILSESRRIDPILVTNAQLLPNCFLGRWRSANVRSNAHAQLLPNSQLDLQSHRRIDAHKE